VTIGPANLTGRDRDLIGRGQELAAIGALLGGAGGGGLLVAGEAGLGKSALLQSAARMAAQRGRTVLRGAGVQSEARVPFAALHQLVYPLASRFGSLAVRQHQALQAAFGHGAGPGPEVFLIAIATLELLADVAAGPGLLVVVDDLQWVDEATTRVLGFVARRIASEPISILAATRPPPPDALTEAGVPVTVLRQLRRDEAAQLVRRRHPGLDGERLSWVLEHADGNPLALAELPLADPAGRTGRPPGADTHVPVTARLERSFAARVWALSPPAQSAVLVAAAADGDDCAEIAAAVSRLVRDQGPESLRAAVDAGVLVVSQATVRFGHPLMRSAVYQSARPDLRRQAHAALAEVLDGWPERRAWHLAAAAVGPDETAAAGLEDAAISAARRGAGPASVAAWERAANLTPQPAGRARRLLRAAELSLELGRPERTRALAARAEPLVQSPADRGRLALIRDTLDPGVPGDPQRVRVLADLATEMTGAGEAELAYRLLLAAAMRVWSADPGRQTRDYLLAAAAGLGVPPDDPRLLSIGGFADPARYGDAITRRIAGLRPGRLDPVSAELAMSVHLVGASEEIAAPAAHPAGLERDRGRGLGVGPARGGRSRPPGQ
jgi:hypothetical protein